MEPNKGGAPWLSHLPVAWRVVPLGWLGRSTGGGTPAKERIEYWGGAIPWVSPKDMKVECIQETEDRITEAALESSAAALLPAGWVLLVTRSGILKHTLPVAINAVPCALNQDMRGFDVASHLNPHFLLRYLQGLNASVLALLVKQGATVESIDADLLRRLPVPVPPPGQQNAICDFLDREAARIDALIEKKTRFIELLREKRQALITQAVTQGLDPSVPMKDSGVAWLGRVPAHWEVTRLGWQISTLNGYAFPSDGFSADESDWRLLRGINVGVGEIRWDDAVYWKRSSDDRLDGFELCAGDVVIGLDRTWIGAGTRIAKISESDLPCLLLQRVAALRCRASMHAEFLFNLLSSEMLKFALFADQTGLSVPHISSNQVERFAVALPPYDEQRRICAQLETHLKSLDLLGTATASSIELLNERRSALITAAVTGQIDLREAA